MTTPSLAEQLRAMYPNEPIGNWGKLAAEQIERLNADLDVTKQNYRHSCESCDNKDAMIAERDAEIAGLRADVESLNQMIRETGQGQGAIDAYVSQCETVERLQEIEREALLRYRRSPLSDSHRVAWEEAAEKARLP